MLSQRRACRLVGVHRSVVSHQPQRGNDAVLRERLKAVAAEFPRYGYKMLHAMLKTEGLVVNRKKTYRIYREERLQVQRKRRKRLPARDRCPLPRPGAPNQRWSMDFISDQLATGRRFRVLNVVDDYTRECLGQITDFSISGARVSRFLDQLAGQRSRPQAIVTDNGPEFTSKAMFLWSQRTGVALRFIQPGKPVQNAVVESFNGKFRDTCLNAQWFVDLADARRSIAAWRLHYNTVRPHSSLGFLSPERFRLADEGNCGQDGRSAPWDTSSRFPLSHRSNGGYNPSNSSPPTWT